MNEKRGGTRTIRNPGMLAGATLLVVVLLVPIVSGQTSSHVPGTLAPSVSHTPLACSVGKGPFAPGFDPVTREMYIPNEGGGNVTVLNGTCHHVGTIVLPNGNGPTSAAFDPANNRMYVSDYLLGHVYVISGLTVVSTITSSLLGDPYGLLWDPGDSMVLATNAYPGNTVVGIQGTSIVGSVAVGANPHGMCYDPFYATVLVMNYGVHNLTILNALDPFLPPVGNIALTGTPNACVFDVADNEDYIAVVGGISIPSAGNVTVVTGTGFIVGTITVGYAPDSIAWDQAKLRVYVGDNFGNVSVISGLTVLKTIVVGSINTFGMTYDDATERVYVTSFANNKVYVLN